MVAIVIFKLDDAATAMDKNFIEPSFHGMMRIGHAQVPLPEDCRRVTIPLQLLC